MIWEETMSKRYVIDCTEQGPTGENMTGQPLESLTPYLWRIDFEGNSESESIHADDPSEANFKVVEMTDVRVEPFDRDAITIFFKAVVEFDLEFDPDNEYGGKFFKRILDEAGWKIKVSSNTVGLETKDGTRDNDSFDGVFDPVIVPLKEV